ncbi:MAG: WecB/TagA/CpsF family glycosyltransferase [Ignavibacteria bacterium]
MHLKEIDFLEIFGIRVSKLTNTSFLKCIDRSIKENKKLSVAYANADTLNKVYSDENLKKIYGSFDLVHPDGIGIYLAAKFLYGNSGLEKRLTGSDFYTYLISNSIEKNWSYFFFGHDTKTLEKISKKYPALNVRGFQEGYNFQSRNVIDTINNINPDILIIGLSCPLQEKWIHKNRDKLNYKVIIAVGDGIKVFADEKRRGPLLLRNLGLEWFARYLTNPVSNFRKYIIGNPLFIYRVLNEKFKSNK